MREHPITSCDQQYNRRTGMNIIKAIIEGKRDANKLAAFRDYR